MIRKVIFILVCLVALSSCHWNGGKSSDSAELNIKVARYDRLLFEYVTMNNLSALQKMNTDFPQATAYSGASSQKYFKEFSASLHS